MVLFSNLSLQKRIGLLVLAGLVVGLGLFSWLGIQSLRESTQRALEQRLVIARMIASQMDGTLTHMILHMETVADAYDELPTGAEFGVVTSSLRQDFADSQISIPNIILADRNGKVIQVEPENSRVIGVDISRYPEVNQALLTGISTISNLVEESLIGTPAVLATAPFFNKDGEVIGVLSGTIDIEQTNHDIFNQAIQVGSTGYTEIVDGKGLVIARTEPGSPLKFYEMSDHPGRFAALIKEGKAAVRTCHRCHEAQAELQLRRDVLAFAPLSVASWGVAIRQSEEEALAPTYQLERQLILLGIIILLGALLLAWAMIRGIVRPVRQLTAAAGKVAAGDFKAVIPMQRKDEIGQLSRAFATMTRELDSSRNELVSRNRELSALNSLAATVSESLNLQEVLEHSLQKVQEITKTRAGCVYLLDIEDNKFKMVFCNDPDRMFNCPESGRATSNCICHRVRRHRKTIMVNKVSQCPLLEDKAKKRAIKGFISIPLKSKNRTLGIMNLAAPDDTRFTKDDFRMLDSIGYHIGLAVENSILYEEARQKEKLRGQLLSSVITAQEDERKRISRELHDEYGQALTGLIMGLESMEDMVSPEHTRLKEKLRSAKSVAAGALEDIRRLTLDLRPLALDDLGLVTAIRTYAHNHLESRGVKVSFESRGLSKRMDPSVETSLFRIVQEAVNNIVKHAGARNVQIQLNAVDGKITVVIEDDGKGFDVAAVMKARKETESLGLLGIQERATLLGGTFTIKSRPGQNTYLKVEIPGAAVSPGLASG